MAPRLHALWHLSLGELQFPARASWWLSGDKVGDMGSIPGSGRSPGEGNGNPLQYSCMGNPKGWRAGWATVNGISKGLDTT